MRVAGQTGAGPVRPFPFPAEENGYLAEHIRLLRDSLLRVAGRDLTATGLSAAESARQIFQAPFIVLSHNTAEDPVLSYANLACMRLFEMDWDRMVVTPSRYTAEAPDRHEREQLLQRVGRDGYIDDYTGVRVSASGRRFRIEKATVWNLSDPDGTFRGQAASFSAWTYLC